MPNFPHFPDKSPINLSNGGNSPSDAKLPFNYEISKYIVNDVVGGQANMIGDYLVGNKNEFKPKVSSFSTLFLNGTKLGLGDNGPGWIKGVSDIHDGVLKSKEGYDSYNKVKKCRKAYKLTNLGAKAPDALLKGAKFGPLSKLNVATAAISAGFAAVETGFNTVKAIDVWKSDASKAKKVSATTDATGSLGDMLMSAGVIATAIPGGQVAGAILWVGSKLVKYGAEHWRGIKKFAGNTIKRTGKALKKGWFS
ncbi:hypothetical protein [Massilibacterium senegalense]|uniref:hypothetical protein n=1 Tax=Massilibacterium senegalense TaxID=1632858 RepID=UPI000781044F|nr:hypothetical protein [Massilibacterium senegalense]